MAAAAQLLHLRVTRLALQTALFRRTRRPRLLAWLRFDQRLLDHCRESCQRIGAVLLLRAQALRIDDDDSRIRQAAASQALESRSCARPQVSPVADVEAQLDCI